MIPGHSMSNIQFSLSMQAAVQVRLGLLQKIVLVILYTLLTHTTIYIQVLLQQVPWTVLVIPDSLSGWQKVRQTHMNKTEQSRPKELYLQLEQPKVGKQLITHILLLTIQVRWNCGICFK